MTASTLIVFVSWSWKVEPAATFREALLFAQLAVWLPSHPNWQTGVAFHVDRAPGDMLTVLTASDCQREVPRSSHWPPPVT